MTMSPQRTPPPEGHTGLPQVLLALEQIRDRAMDPEQRLAMLRALRDRVESLQAQLLPQGGPDQDRDPDQDQQRAGAAATPDRACADRLTASWCGNLRHLLNELGHPRAARQACFPVYREWVVRQLLKALGRSVEQGVRTGCGVPPGTWRTLHDLFFFLDGRDETGASPAPGAFNPGIEYKRLLLIGTLGGERDAGQLLAQAEARLRGWAGASALRRDTRIVGESSMLRLDLGADAPPRRTRPGDAQPYHGWVLEPAAGFLALLAGRPSGRAGLAAAA